MDITKQIITKIIREYGNATLPVICKSDDVLYPYFGTGTCFIICINHNKYIITAKHVINKLKCKHNDILIQFNIKSKNFLPIETVYKPNAIITNDDDDYADLLIYKIGKIIIKKNKNKIYCSDFKNYLGENIDYSRGKLVVIGYLERNIDYELKNISGKLVYFKSVHLGNSESQHCQKLQLIDTLSYKSLDGLSGAPVIFIDNFTNTLHLAGMIIRGTIESKICHFISSYVIYKLFQKILNTSIIL